MKGETKKVEDWIWLYWIYYYKHLVVTVHRLLYIVYCLLSIVYCLLSIVYCLFSMVLFIVYCLMSIVYFLMTNASHLLSFVCCLLSIAYCLWSMVDGLLSIGTMYGQAVGGSWWMESLGKSQGQNPLSQRPECFDRGTSQGTPFTMIHPWLFHTF